MATKLAKLAVALAALVGVAAIVAVGLLLRDGISARPAPGAVETVMARQLRTWAIPRTVGDRRNPEPGSRENVHSGLEHFADHCAICHANDGGGDTEIGRSLYPRAPDMRLPATQELSDGELF